MGNDDSNLSKALVFLGAAAFMLCLALVGAVVYLYVYTFKQVANINTSVLEIKSKIGAVIRDVNYINGQEYNVDSSQESKLGIIMNKVGLQN